MSSSWHRPSGAGRSAARLVATRPQDPFGISLFPTRAERDITAGWSRATNLVPSATAPRAPSIRAERQPRLDTRSIPRPVRAHAVTRGVAAATRAASRDGTGQLPAHFERRKAVQVPRHGADAGRCRHKLLNDDKDCRRRRRRAKTGRGSLDEKMLTASRAAVSPTTSPEGKPSTPQAGVACRNICLIDRRPSLHASLGACRRSGELYVSRRQDGVPNDP